MICGVSKFLSTFHLFRCLFNFLFGTNWCVCAIMLQSLLQVVLEWVKRVPKHLLGGLIGYLRH